MNMEVETTGLERQTQTAENSRLSMLYIMFCQVIPSGGGSQVPQSSIVGPLKITIVITVIIMCFSLIF